MNKYDLIKKPVDYRTGEKPDKCSKALFPGYGICGYEPHIIVKLYDSLLFQMPDTGLFIYDLPDDADEECRQGFLSGWELLGRPDLIVTCPRLAARIGRFFPEVKVISLYDLLIELSISGGCNAEDYTMHAPADIDSSYIEDVRVLAEDMGVRFKEDDGRLPFITCSMADRNMLKSQGRNAAHILELIYGMGDSNTHLIHEDDHGDCDGNCQTCSLAGDCESEAGGQKVDISLPVKSQPSPLPDQARLEANMQELKSDLLALFWNGEE